MIILLHTQKPNTCIFPFLLEGMLLQINYITDKIVSSPIKTVGIFSPYARQISLWSKLLSIMSIEPNNRNHYLTINWPHYYYISFHLLCPAMLSDVLLSKIVRKILIIIFQLICQPASMSFFDIFIYIEKQLTIQRY